MNEPYIHPCGDTLMTMFKAIQLAVHNSIKTQYKSGVSPNKLPHFWYVHRGWVKKATHPAVFAALEVGPPKDLHQLVLEAPHVSTDGRLAYTQTDDKGRRDIQTVTTPGKYLTRHFPQFKADRIRGLAEVKIGCRFINTMPEMLHAMKTGPKSCMQWTTTSRTHPYESYDPMYGWGMAVNEEGTDTIGRALVHFPSMTFVRTYRKDSGYRVQSCNLMQDWLKSKGFTHASGWPEGSMLRYIEDSAPYLDGDLERANPDRHEGQFVWILTEDGRHALSNTNGGTTVEDEEEDNDYVGECDCCNDGVYDRETYYHTGPDSETLVCCNCYDEHYIHVTGYRNCEYDIHEDNVIQIDGVDYDSNYLCDVEDLVYVDSEGKYYHGSDCFYCDVANEYYCSESEDYVELANGNSAASCNAWQCQITDKWYPKGDDNRVELADGRIVHWDKAWCSDGTGLWYGSDQDHDEDENGGLHYIVPEPTTESA